MTQRIEKINELIKQEVGKLILKEADISRDVLVTVIKADTSPDLRSSAIYITALPEIKEQEILRELEFKTFDIQQELNKKIRVKFVPKIEFKIDKQAHAEQRIYEIMEREEQ